MTYTSTRVRRLGKVTVGLIGIATLLLSAGCGTSGPQADSGASAPPAGTGAASVWIMSGVTEKAFNASFTRWAQAHPSESFSAESFANDAYKTKIRAALGTGEAPTLIYGWGGGGLRDYVSADALVDLSDVMADPEVSARFLPSVAKVGDIGGKSYAVPNNGMKPVMIYYNKDVFSQLDIQPPASWDDLMALVPTLLDAGIAPFTVAGQAQWTLLPYFAYLLDRIGGPEVIQNIVAGGPDGWSDPAVAEALTKIQDLVKAKGFVNGFSSISTDGGADIALLYSGKAAMSLGLPANYQTIKTANPDFIAQGKLGYAPFPTVAGGKGDPKNVTGNPSNYWSVSASASPEAQKIAKDYIKEQLLNSDYVADLLAINNVPPSAGIEDQLKASPEGDYYSYLYQMVQEAPHFQLSLDQELAAAQAQALLTNLQQIFLLETTPQQFVDAMNTTIGQ